MQCTSKTYPTSFVITDPKGSILIECGKMLQKFGYRIRFLNTINMKKSMHYNPFAYIHSEKDILKLVTTLIANTKGEGKGGDDFWVKAETLLFTALIGYIHYEAPTEEQNFSTLLEMINAMEVREDDEEFENPVDLMFKELESRPIRSREVSACLVLQAQSQLKAIYKDNADTIIGNMDATVFLGGKEPTTLKELAASLGKETIDTYNTGESHGRETSHSLNYQKLGKELMSQDELAVMDGGKCILQLRGVRPFLSDKFDITKHPNYKYLSDYDKKNAFNIERFLSARLKLRPDEQFAAYSIDLSGDEAAEETGG